MKASNIRICVTGLRGIPGVMGGIETHCEQIYPRLKLLNPGLDITILGRRPYLESEPYEFQGLRVTPLPAPKNKYFEAIISTTIAVFYARFVLRSDILHIHGIGPALLGPLARLLGMKVVVTHHGRDFEREKWNYFAKLALRLGERCATAAPHHLIVVSKSLTEELHRRNPRCKSEIEYIPNGITEFADAPAEDGSQSVFGRLGLEPGRYILAVGRLVPEKGLHVLIEAFKAARPDLKLAIVGRADHDDSYSRSLLQHASDQIIFCGFQAKPVLKNLYRHAALFVLPSTHEGLPIAALEAIGENAPIVLSDIQPNRDIGLPQSNYFPVGDGRALTGKLSEEYSRFRVDRDMFAARFNWDHISEATLKVYLSLA